MEFSFEQHVIRVNVPTEEALATEVRARFASGDGFALATVNVDHLVKLQTSRAFRIAYAAQDLVVADGNPIVWLSKLAGRKVDLMPGSDLIIPLAILAAEAGVPVALVGTTDESLRRSVDALIDLVPGLKITTRIAPSAKFDPHGTEALRIYDDLNDAGIRLCFTALGAPKQEEFAARGRAYAPEVGFVSIGAGLDFLSGHQTRAPRWVRAVALEWAWRLASNPRRLARRYWQCFRALPRHVIAARALRTVPVNSGP